MEGCIGVTAHFIDLSWEMRSVVLASAQMEESHTGVNIAKPLIELTTKFKVVDKVGGFIHDNASNCNVAARVTSLALGILSITVCESRDYRSTNCQHVSSGEKTRRAFPLLNCCDDETA